MSEESLEAVPLPDELPAETSEAEHEDAPVVEAEPASEPEAEQQSEEPEGKPERVEEEGETKSQRKRRLRREREHEKDRALAEAQSKISALEERLAAQKAPDEQQFANPDDYVAERAAHATETRFLQREREAAEAARDAAQADIKEERSRAIDEVFSEGQTEHADFDSVVRNRNLPLSEDMVSAAIEAENSADVLYHLGKNEGEAWRIARLSPVAQAVEIGRLSTKLAAPKPKPSSAPAPIKPLKGGASAEKSPEDMSYSEYVAWRKKTSA